jgi:hypothetical protein
MLDTQTAISLGISFGQLIGTVGALVWFTRGLKADLQKLQEQYSGRLEKIQEQHYRLREEIAEKYLKRDEWLSHHNKLEAQITRKLERIEELLRGER